VGEAIPRWRLFPREIEHDLSYYHDRDIADWHEGRMSSRKLLVLTDGLPDDSWYKLSVQALIKRMAEDKERARRSEVKNLIFAQLTGQKVGG
jgi:hypothetical protein